MPLGIDPLLHNNEPISKYHFNQNELHPQSWALRAVAKSFIFELKLDKLRPGRLSGMLA